MAGGGAAGEAVLTTGPGAARSAPLSIWSRLSQRSQSNLYFALVFLGRRRRDDFRDVYRFVRAADDAADASGEPAVRAARLAAWRHELDAIYAGTATHPWGRRLAQVVARRGLDRGQFERLLDAIERDVHKQRMASWAELRAYCEDVAAPLAYLSLQLLGADGPAARRYARDVAVALQLANIVRDVADDAARGYVYLPADELAAAGVAEDDVLAGRASPGLSAVCRRQAERARELIAEARARLDPDTRRALLVPEIWADVYLALLDELERAGFEVIEQRPYLPRRRKLRIAVRRWVSDRATATPRRVLRALRSR